MKIIPLIKKKKKETALIVFLFFSFLLILFLVTRTKPQEKVDDIFEVQRKELEEIKKERNFVPPTQEETEKQREELEALREYINR
jgi:cell shape-determining protein MreC